MAEVVGRARTSQPGFSRRIQGVGRRVVNSIARWWRTRTATKVLLFAGIVSAGVYVVGDVLSGLTYMYNSARPYSFKDQWISELTALGSPVRPLMVAVITLHGLLGAAFAVGILRAAGQSRALRWVGWVLLAATAVSIWIHPFFPMSSRWLERSFTDTMHGTLTFVWVPIICGAVALSAVAYRGWFRYYSIATLLLMTGFGIASGIAIQGLEQNDTPWAGAFERINAYALMAWLVVLAVTVMHRSLSDATAEKHVEHLWIPAIATGGNPSQMGYDDKPAVSSKTVAAGCDRLPRDSAGKGALPLGRRAP